MERWGEIWREMEKDGKRSGEMGRDLEMGRNLEIGRDGERFGEME